MNSTIFSRFLRALLPAKTNKTYGKWFDFPCHYQIQILIVFSVQSKYSKKTKSNFFSSSVADVALKARSLHEHKQKRYLYKGQIMSNGAGKSIKPHTTTKTNQHDDPQIPQPDLRFASGKTKQTAKTQKQHKRGQSPTRTPTKSICRETQWLVHCITRKNVPNELISRLSGKQEG